LWVVGVWGVVVRNRTSEKREVEKKRILILYSLLSGGEFGIHGKKRSIGHGELMQNRSTQAARGETDKKRRSNSPKGGRHRVLKRNIKS